jgi:hypothetical protein
MNTNGWGIGIFQEMLGQREERRKKLRSELEELEKDIQSIQHTQRLYMIEHGIPELPQAPLLEHNLSLTKRRGNALIEWAERNKGILVVKEAKRSLVAAGLIKPGRGVGWITYGTIANMDCWEKIKPGVYKLLKTKDGNIISFDQMRKHLHSIV